MEHDPKLLKKICEEVVSDPNYVSRDITGDDVKETFCNWALNRICQEYAAYSGFEGLLANQIHDKMVRSPVWHELQGEEAADAAAIGGLVIASRKKEGHGHVAVVWPDTLTVYSGKWKKYVPKVANVGKDNKICGANYAFGDPPKYFAYLERKEIEK